MLLTQTRLEPGLSLARQDLKSYHPLSGDWSHMIKELQLPDLIFLANKTLVKAKNKEITQAIQQHWDNIIRRIDQASFHG